MKCPQCRSDNTRKYSIIYEEGTSQGKSEGSSDRGSYETAHFSQTLLAKRCSPPKEPEIGKFLSFIRLVFSGWLGCRFGSFAGGFWWGAGAFVLSVIGLTFVWNFLAGKNGINTVRNIVHGKDPSYAANMAMGPLQNSANKKVYFIR